MTNTFANKRGKSQSKNKGQNTAVSNAGGSASPSLSATMRSIGTSAIPDDWMTKLFSEYNTLPAAFLELASYGEKSLDIVSDDVLYKSILQVQI